MAKTSKAMKATQGLMAALVRQPPKLHQEISPKAASKAKGKKAKRKTKK
jgi:hypothetical protein